MGSDYVDSEASVNKKDLQLALDTFKIEIIEEMAKESLHISKSEIELQLGEFKKVAVKLENELAPMLMEDVRNSCLKNKEQRDELELTIQDMKNEFKEAFMQLDCMHNRATRERSDL
jgi:hypothetical protein